MEPKAVPKKAAPAKPVPARKAAAAVKIAAELELAEVKTLLKMGKAKGSLSEDEIGGALSDIDLSDEQVENIYVHFSRCLLYTSPSPRD